MPDHHILSWSYDNTIRLWDHQTGSSLSVLLGHSDWVNGAMVMPDGRILSWSEDKTLRIWNIQTGKALCVLEVHSGSITGALAMPCGQILSWSPDKTLRIWDRQTGGCIAVLEGHSGWVNGAMTMPDGRILSWSEDKTLRIWNNQTGKCIAILNKALYQSTHSNGAPEGWVFTWGKDKNKSVTLNKNSYNKTPKFIIYQGHSTINTDGTMLLSDGRIISWDKESKLHIWDSQGTLLAVHPITKGLQLFPALRTAIAGANRSHSGCLFAAKDHAGCLWHFSEQTKFNVYWHGEQMCTARHLFNDGRAVVTQDNGQISIIHLYRGNRSISIEELERI